MENKTWKLCFHFKSLKFLYPDDYSINRFCFHKMDEHYEWFPIKITSDYSLFYSPYYLKYYMCTDNTEYYPYMPEDVFQLCEQDYQVRSIK